jgi:opacity protein-like surface antigen
MSIRKYALAAFTTLLIASSANASMVGPYFAALVGWGNIHQSSASGTGLNTTSSQSTGIAGQLDGGYQFNSVWALDAGYTKFTSGTIHANNPAIGVATATINLNTYAIHVMAKGIIQLQNGLEVYGKLGPAYLRENVALEGTSTPPPQGLHDGHTLNKVYPAVALGISFNFNNNLGAEISIMHIQQVGDTQLHCADFAGAGLVYYFG